MIVNLCLKERYAYLYLENEDTKIFTFSKNVSGDKDLVNALMELLSDEDIKHKMQKTDLFLILPNSMIAYDCMSLPFINKNKTKDSVKVKLSVNLKDYNNYLINNDIIVKNKTNQICFISYVNKNIIESAKKLIKDNKIYLKGIDFYSQATITNLIYENNVLKNGWNLVVNIEKEQTLVTICHKNEVVGYSSINIGECQACSDEIVTENEIASKYINFVTKKSNSKIKNVTIKDLEDYAPKTSINKFSNLEKINNLINSIQNYFIDETYSISFEKVYICTNSDKIFDGINTTNKCKIANVEPFNIKYLKNNRVFRAKNGWGKIWEMLNKKL